MKSKWNRIFFLPFSKQSGITSSLFLPRHLNNMEILCF